MPRPQGEVDKQLAIQLKMLREACDRFDAGADYEAPNLARIMRILFRKTRNQHPLLEQAGLEGSMFVDTAIQETTGGLLSYAGLISTALRSDGTVGFRADLDDRLGNRLVAFDEWWNASVGQTPHDSPSTVQSLADFLLPIRFVAELLVANRDRWKPSFKTT